MKRFTYSDYEFKVRVQPKAEYFVKYANLFRGARRVLDIGCGRGLFLSVMLPEFGDQVQVTGIDSDESVVKCAQEHGLPVVYAHALDYLKSNPNSFDGVFCSHVVEHLAFEEVVDLVEAIVLALSESGIVVLVFPNPESLDMQLLYFWKDPQHVRFYHGDLIKGLLEHYGFSIERFGSVTNREGISTLTLSRDISKRVYSRWFGIRPLRAYGRKIKGLLGTTRLGSSIMHLEQELDYLKRLRSIGEEFLIVAQKCPTPQS